MFLKCSLKPALIEPTIVKKFVRTCHRTYFRKYDLLGHHHLGWGVAHLSEGKNLITIRRDITPIYKADWKGLERIKTRFLVVHARKAYPWSKSEANIHPINIGTRYLMTHNGTIKMDSFPKLSDPSLERLKNSTTMDTRRYLCSLTDFLQSGMPMKQALETLIKTVKIGIGANAFIFNSNECHIVNYHANRFNGRHRTLFLSKDHDSLLIGTTPLVSYAKEIENNALLSINLSDLSLSFQKLEV